MAGDTRAEAAERALDSAAAEALRCVDEVRELLDSATHGDLAERVAQVKEKLAASHESLARASRSRESLGRALHAGETALHEELEEIEQRIRENPLGALLAAAGAGLLLGLALSRHR